MYFLDQIMANNLGMAQTTKWLPAILDYMKKAKWITSTVFGPFSLHVQLV